MKWILCGKNDAAVQSLELLLERGDEVWALGTAGDDGLDGWQRSLRGAATRLGARFSQPKRINDPDVVADLAAFGADALISIQYDQILRGGLFRAIDCPCLNLHFSLLPRHRGVAPIAWAVLSADTEAGVTLHHMIEDIDAGDVIAQRRVPVEPGDSARDAYEKVSGAAAELFAASYPFPAELLSTRLVQDQSVASYHRNGDFDFTVRHTDWARPAAELHRWLRAMIFPPFQYPHTRLNGRWVAISRVIGALGEPVSAPPGEVVAWSPVEVEVAAGDRSIRIASLVDEDEPRASPEKVMRSLTVGDRLG